MIKQQPIFFINTIRLSVRPLNEITDFWSSTAFH